MHKQVATAASRKYECIHVPPTICVKTNTCISKWKQLPTATETPSPVCGATRFPGSVLCMAFFIKNFAVRNLCIKTLNILCVASQPSLSSAWPHLIKKICFEKIWAYPCSSNNLCQNQHNPLYGLISLWKFASRKYECINVPLMICVVTTQHNSQHGPYFI